MHYRFQTTVKDHSYLKKLRILSRTCKGEEVIELTHVQELPTVDLHKDNDIHFPSVPNNTTPHHSLGHDIVVNDIKDGTDYDDEVHLDEHIIPSYRFMGSQWVWPKVMVLKLIQPILHIIQMKVQVLISMTTWFLKDITIDVGNSTREMWVGCEFPDRKNQGL